MCEMLKNMNDEAIEHAESIKDDNLCAVAGCTNQITKFESCGFNVSVGLCQDH